ncbi:MAG TPA: Smr/MutS family protein [Acidiferrobacter sp.]|nr:Smr/MutS family protein [Acidiferrobacter sp.]
MAEKPEDQKKLFAGAVVGARKLTQDRVAPFRPRVRPIPRPYPREADAIAADRDHLSAHDIDIGAAEELLFLRSGISKEVMRRVKRGQIAIEDELDLHGLTVDQARLAFVEFLRAATDQGWRCVRIIHGKGLGSETRLPVLKGCVNAWLRQKTEVLAFCSARPADGGTGAVYVLLRRAL